MQLFKRSVWLCAALVLPACGGPEQQEATDPLATQSAAIYFPANVSVAGCSYNLNYVQRAGSVPPYYDVVLTRYASGTCAHGAGSVVLGQSANYTADLSMVGTSQGIAAGFIWKTTYSGSSPTVLGLKHVTLDTMTIVRNADIYPAFGSGYIHTGVLSMLSDGTTLKVIGSKTGTILGESGSGSHYTATFPNFFTSTTPPTVTATP